MSTLPHASSMKCENPWKCVSDIIDKYDYVLAVGVFRLPPESKARVYRSFIFSLPPFSEKAYA